jgi:hypothetical protein
MPRLDPVSRMCVVMHPLSATAPAKSSRWPSPRDPGNRFHMSKLLIALTAAALAVPAPARAPADDTAAMHARVQGLLGQMTLEEKIGQLEVLGDDYGDLGALAKAGKLSATNGVLNDRDVAKFTRHLQDMAMQSRLKIPLIFEGDVAHGYYTILPIPLAMAATWDTALVTRAHRQAALEATASGVSWTFSPMLDIARDPRWGRIAEGAGEDPYLGSAMAVAQMKGFQGGDLSRPDTMMATAKHFAGYGAAQAGRDYGSTDIPPRQFRDVYLPPFKAAADAGIGSVMAAFTAIDGVPAARRLEVGRAAHLRLRRDSRAGDARRRRDPGRCGGDGAPRRHRDGPAFGHLSRTAPRAGPLGQGAGRRGRFSGAPRPRSQVEAGPVRRSLSLRRRSEGA